MTITKAINDAPQGPRRRDFGIAGPDRIIAAILAARDYRHPRNDRRRWSDDPATITDGSANHQISDQHFGLKPAAGVCHNDELDRKGDDKLVSTTGTDADLIQSIRIGFAASRASAAGSSIDPATQSGLP
jgi:hypothetical protein